MGPAHVRLLFTGRGTSGSWQIRGSQLAAALGADAAPNALEVRAYDLAVVVKRAPADLLQRIHAAGVPLIWDVVDAWPQPVGNTWDRAACMSWLRQRVAEIRPAGIVAATQAMARDCAEFGVPVLALPHHARPGLERAPIRPVAEVVAYEGGPQHLGSWRPWLEDQCTQRGMRFVVNPAGLIEADIVVALRELTGYAPTHWKSGLKATNARAAGVPCILAREAGYLETAIGGECWADIHEEVAAALDELRPFEVRLAASAQLVNDTMNISRLAVEYAAWLKQF